VAINGTLTARQGIKSNFHIVQTRLIGVLSVAINGTLTARQGIKSNFHIVQTRLIGVLSVAKKKRN